MVDTVSPAARSISRLRHTLGVAAFAAATVLVAACASAQVADDRSKCLSDANTLDSRAFVHLKMGDLADAIAYYDAALRLDPKIASSLCGRGLSKLRMGDLAGS